MLSSLMCMITELELIIKKHTEEVHKEAYDVAEKKFF